MLSPRKAGESIATDRLISAVVSTPAPGLGQYCMSKEKGNCDCSPIGKIMLHQVRLKGNLCSMASITMYQATVIQKKANPTTSKASSVPTADTTEPADASRNVPL